MARPNAFQNRRSRAIAGILFASAFILGGFQNCGDMRSSLAQPSVPGAVLRVGVNGEKITGFEPDALYAGGGILTVRGEGFTENTYVKIDGADCLEPQVVSPQEYKCRAPALALGAKVVEIAGAQMPYPLGYVDFAKVSSVAGRNGVKGSIDGVGRLARMDQVGGMASDGTYLYFTEEKLGLVRSMNMDTFEVKTIAGSPYGAVDYNQFADGIGDAARFHTPGELAYKDGALYVTDRENCAIRKVTLSDRAVSTYFGGAPSNGDPCEVVDGDSSTAKMGHPQSIMVDGNFLYIGEQNGSSAYVLRRLNLNSKQIITIAGRADLDIDDDTLRGAWLPEASSLTQTLVLDTPLETPHPMSANEDVDFSITKAGAIAMRVHFTQFDVGDYGVDFDNAEDLTLLEDFKGNQGSDFWSPVFSGDTVKISGSLYGENLYGFKIDKIEYTTNPNAALVHSHDGPALSTALGGISSLLKIGNEIYFGDADLHLVRKLNLTSGKVSGVVGTEGSVETGAFWKTGFSAVAGLAADSRFLYISDLGNGPRTMSPAGERILKMDLVTRETSVLVQSDPNYFPANVDGPLGNAMVMQPRNLLYDSGRGLFFDCFDVIRRVK